MVLKELILAFTTLGGCSGPERYDSKQFSTLRGYGVLEGIDF